MKHVIVICTRNRPNDLRITLESVASLEGDVPHDVCVIDASDDADAVHMRTICNSIQSPDVRYHKYDEKPSLARQRNLAMKILVDTCDIIHFIDDDVTLDPAYLSEIDRVFATNEHVGGVGGRVVEERLRHDRAPTMRPILSAFLLYASRPGRVLPSGHESPAQVRPLTKETPVEWLNGCAAYRTSVLRRFRCDESLEGYSLDEDLDLSFRIGRSHSLLVAPSASMVHRRSEANRQPGKEYFSDYLVHRYWFVRKNIAAGFPTAFWWSTVGRLLRAAMTSGATRPIMIEGYLDGIRRIIRKDHYLLGSDTPERHDHT